MRRKVLQLSILFGLVSIPVLFTLTNTGFLHAQQRAQRIILKDGSYQPVTKYEVQGDHVHYLSAERYEWEDIPNSLVDWDATNKYNAGLSSGRGKLRVEETPEEREEREAEEANSPEVAPGLHLPGTGGVFLLDTFQAAPEAAEILQNGSELSKNTKHSVLGPIAGARQSFELKGGHAQIQSHVPRPSIYIDIDIGSQETGVVSSNRAATPDASGRSSSGRSKASKSADSESTPANSAERFRLVRAEVKKDARAVGSLKVSLSGKMSEQNAFVPATIEKVGKGAWLKITPNQDLAPGEYAVVEMLGPDEMNTYVWDFGVNPKAPANPNTWRPVPAQSKAVTR